MFNTKDKFSLDVFVVNGWQKQVGPGTCCQDATGIAVAQMLAQLNSAAASSTSTVQDTASRAADSPSQWSLQHYL